MLSTSLSGRPGCGITTHGFDPDNAPDLFVALDHEQVWTYIPGARPRTAAELTARLTRLSTQLPLIIVRGGHVVGTSSFHLDPSDPSMIEIGSTLLSPQTWGSGVNTAVKQMMLAAAFSAGAQWVQLRTDERNHRSAAAILKLAGVIETQQQIEPQWIRADETVRTSRMFRVQQPTRAEGKGQEPITFMPLTQPGIHREATHLHSAARNPFPLSRGPCPAVND